MNIDSSDAWHLTWNVVVTSTSSVNEELWIWLCASYVTSGMFYATVNLSVSTLGHTLCNLSASITSPCYFLVDAVAPLFSVVFFFCHSHNHCVFVIHIITVPGTICGWCQEQILQKKQEPDHQVAWGTSN